MGAQPSTFSHELKNPTRTLSSQLHLNDKQRTFTFVQHMQKAVGEQQTLRTRITYTGTLHNINSDVADGKGRVVKGCPVYRLRTERVRFEVEWGSEWWQCKKGTLTREDILAKERRRGSKGGAGKCTPIVTSTVTPPASALFNPSTAVTAPSSPSSTNRSAAAAAASSSSSSSSTAFTPVMLPPAMDSLPRGFSHSAPLSPAPLSFTERQRSHIDVETSGETPVQPITADNKTIKPTTTTSSSSTSLSSASTSAASPSATTTSKPTLSPPHTVTITYHGTYHTQLQAATSLEEMADLLQADTSDWSGSFGMGGLELHCRVLSEEVRVEYWRPKFEYLWAQVADECPVIMALSNVFHDQQMQEMYLPRAVKG